MTTATPLTGIDDLDGLPAHQVEPGRPLPGGVLAYERLGVGHRCETWLAWSPALWSTVVVKFPRPHQVTHPRARDSLRRETDALTGLVHPHLPALVTDGTDADVPYLHVEYLSGDPLDVLIDDDGPFAPDDVAVLGVQLLAALRSVHGRGVAHLDVKTENVMLVRTRPVLIDFGSARMTGARQPANRPIGSAGYAAPELEAGAPIDAAMDVFGVGVTLYELLAGTPAFDPHLPAAERATPAPLPSSPVAAIVDGMIAVAPQDRPDLVTALARLGHVAAELGRDVWPSWASRLLVT